MKYRGLVISFLAMIFLLPSALCAHGVKRKGETGGIVVTAEYDTGEAMSYAKVKILAPGTEMDASVSFLIREAIGRWWRMME